MKEVREKLAEMGNAERAEVSKRYFKTGPGEYAEGDQFLGVAVPKVRSLARELRSLPLQDTEALLRSPIHEERLLALFILVHQYSKSEWVARQKIHRLYLRNIRFVNNWDLVDSSAGYIIGAHLWEQDRKMLYRLAVSRSLWERRIAILSTFYFIRKGDYSDTFRIAELLLNDKEDLIHKGVGWMLREVGNQDVRALRTFLDKHAAHMPRTMLRYAIEKFPEPARKKYLGR